MNEYLRFLRERSEKLSRDRASLVSYLLQKVDNDRDYHAVADASMDIREIDAQLKLIDEVFKLGQTIKAED